MRGSQREWKQLLFIEGFGALFQSWHPQINIVKRVAAEIIQSFMNYSQLIVFALSIYLVSAVCLPESQLQNLESGLLDASASSQMLQFTSNGQAKYTYQFRSQFNIKPQTAFSLSFFDGNPIGGFGFSITANTSNTGMAVSLNLPTPLIKWTQLRFTFIASTRNDIQLGQYSVQNWNQNQRVATIPFGNTINDVSAFATRAFLSGIQIPLIVGNLSLQVNGLVFNSTTFTVGVASGSVIKSISISYVLFPITSQSFAFSAGTFAEQSVNGTFYQNAQGSLNSLIYYIYGITGFELEKTQFSLSSSLSDTYLLSVTGKVRNVVVSYLSFGLNPSVTCQHCNATLPMYRFGCAKVCENGMNLYNYSSTSQGCVMCQQSAGFKSSASGCVCAEGKTRVRNSCVDNNKVSNANLSSSQTQSQFFKDLAATTPQSGVTFAVPNQVNALGASQCQDPNAYFTGSLCVCRPGYYQISGSCNQCPFASYYNGVDCIDTRTGLSVGQSIGNSQVSFNVNGDLQAFGQSKIEIQSGQTIVNVGSTNGGLQVGVQTTGSQGPIPQQMVLPPGAIPHNTGVDLNQGANQINIQQIAGSAGLGNGGATVISLTNEQNGINAGISAEPGAIPHGAYLSDGTNLGGDSFNTLLSQGFSQSNFGPDSFFDNSMGVLGRRQSSTSPSSLQYFLASLFGSSSSSQSMSSSSNDASFFFPAGMIPFGTSSFSELTQSSFFSAPGYCPVNEYLGSNNVCTCIPGYQRNTNNFCTISLSVGFMSTSLTLSDITLIVAPNRSQCTSAYSYVTPDDYCTCRLGYAFNTNYVCFPIPTNMNCAQGSILYANNTCACPRDFFNNSGVCQTCPPYHYWNGQVCIAACPANSAYSTANRNCSCNPGFIASAPNVCVACPSNAITFNNICVGCPINSRLVAGQCQCIPGTTYIQGSCTSTCPVQTYYDTTLQKCLCIQPNFFIDTTNNCISCPIGQFYDGQACIPCTGINSYFDSLSRTCRYCPPPGFVSRGECVRCPDGTDWSAAYRRCICISSAPTAPLYCQVPGTLTLAGLPPGNNPPTPGSCGPNGYLSNGICVYCPINSQLVNTQCICNPGFVSNANGVCIQTCTNGVLTNQGLCVTCPANSQWQASTQSCICNAGFTLSSGSCVRACGIASQLNQVGVCVCLTGYFPIGDLAGNCALCGVGCRTCTSQTTCTQCLTGYGLFGAVCINVGGPLPPGIVGLAAPGLVASAGSTTVSNTINTNVANTNIAVSNVNIGAQAVCTVANCLTCPNGPSICSSCIANYYVFNGQCAQPSGICPTGCPRLQVCVQSQCIDRTTVTTSTTTTTSTSSFSTSGQIMTSSVRPEELLRQARQALAMGTSGLVSTQSVSFTGSTSSQSIIASNTRTTIQGTTFTATVTPTADSLTLSYPSLLASQYPRGICEKNIALPSNWTCQMIYENQPISIQYSVLMTARVSGAQWRNTTSINPITSRV